MTNPDKRTSYLKKLVSACRALVTYQIGLPLGCTRIARVLTWLKPWEELHYSVFAEYSSATRDLPVGTERLQWARDVLREKDIRFEAINRKFRDRIFEACYDIIDRYAHSVDEAPSLM